MLLINKEWESKAKGKAKAKIKTKAKFQEWTCILSHAHIESVNWNCNDTINQMQVKVELKSSIKVDN